MNHDLYITYDDPVPYKGLKIYPVSVRDYAKFSAMAECLILDKNSIPDAKIISMSYLEYIFYTTQENFEEHPYLLWLDRLLALCLKESTGFEDIEKSISRYKYDDNGRGVIVIDDEIYTGQDFDAIKEIICEQNLLEPPDENIQKEVRDSLESAKKYKEQLSETKQGSFEDYIIALSISTGWSFEYIYNMSVRKFIKSIRRMDNLIHYKIYLGASMSGMVEFKDKSFIKHWLTSLDSEDKYKDVAVNLDEVEGKVSLESAKK